MSESTSEPSPDQPSDGHVTSKVVDLGDRPLSELIRSREADGNIRRMRELDEHGLLSVASFNASL